MFSKNIIINISKYQRNFMLLNQILVIHQSTSLVNLDLLKTNILIQQTPPLDQSDLRYSIMLVIVCLLTLVLLWLPDLIKGIKNF